MVSCFITIARVLLQVLGMNFMTDIVMIERYFGLRMIVDASRPLDICPLGSPFATLSAVRGCSAFICSESLELFARFFLVVNPPQTRSTLPVTARKLFLGVTIVRQAFRKSRGSPSSLSESPIAAAAAAAAAAEFA